MLLDIAKKNQPTDHSPEKLDNKEDPNKNIGRRKRQDLQSKLGVWGSRERVE